MSINLYLQAGTAQQGAQLPGTAQALLNYVAANVLVIGAGDVGWVNFGYLEPSADNRAFPWWRTDVNGNPIGMYSWNGSAWVTVPTLIANGPTESRPINASEAQEYFDTTISRLLIWDRGQWRTADGGIGEVREYVGTAAAVLTANPGWIEYAAGAGRVIGGYDTTHAIGATVGADSQALSIANLPAHTHPSYQIIGSESDNGDVGALVITADSQSTAVSPFAGTVTGSTGTGDAVPVLQPTIYLVRIIKQ